MPIGRRISIESLEGKILAIDASIWLTQFLMAMRDPDTGNVRPAAHLIGFFRRLCKLRYQGVRPVLVFDGPTPEIKLRELSERRKRRERISVGESNSGADNAVQRMARRLLAQQLKKKKGISMLKASSSADNGKESKIAAEQGTTTSRSAYAPGFYDPQMNQEDQPSAKDSLSDTNKGENESTGRNESASRPNENVESQNEAELVQILEDETDYLDEATSRVNTKSDWDADLPDQNSDSDNANRDREENEQHMTTLTSVAKNAATNGFDIDFVAALPPTQRKDMVESAQRQRRLQSRSEFMKVAYDPEGLSKCQLRNFLRSTKLNQDIHEMARQAAQAEGRDDAIASDGTKRIIFETNGKTIKNSWQRHGRRKELLPSGKKNRLSVLSMEEAGTLSKNNSLQNRDKTATFQVSTNTEPSQIPEDTDSGSGSESDFEDDESMRRHDENDGEKVREQNDLQDTDDDTPVNQTKDDEQIAQELNDEILARALQGVSSDEDDDDDDYGGGFLQEPETEETPRLSRAVARPSIDDNSTDDGKPFSQPIHLDVGKSVGKNAVDNESKQKGMYAFREGNNQCLPPSSTVQVRELLVDEGMKSGGGGFLATDDGRQGNESTKLDASSHSPKGNTNVSSPPRSDQEDTDEDCAWEDGDIDKTTVDTGPDLDVGIERSTIEQNKAERPLHSSQGNSQVDNEHNSAESDEDVEWEDNNDDEVQYMASSRDTNPPFQEKEETNRKNEENDDDFDDDGAIVVSGENPFGNAFRDSSDGESQQLAEALQRAQTTAANLTNWAGRAFRRAVAQHAGEHAQSLAPNSSGTPVGVPPKPSDKANYDRTSVGATSESHLVVSSNESPTAKFQVIRNAKPADNEFAFSGDERKSRNGDAVATKQSWPETLEGSTVLETLEAYQEKWEEERKQQERDMDTVTDEMRADAMQLLQLFGVPYIEAPAEAEAQCVALERLGLVDGIVTEDSDAFVFGGQHVYKNIFDDQKYVEVYNAADAKREMNLTRDSLVALAMLLGGDYTEGVKGVGIVNGMEIVQAFDVSTDVQVGLERFRQWLDGFDPADVLDLARGKHAMTSEAEFHRTHHTARMRWVAPKYFPDPKVLAAYLNPVVDTSKERFSWGVPDTDRLVLFCSKHIGWTAEETKKLVEPVVKKIESSGSMHQTRIDSFMRYEDGIKFADVRSKRLRQVLKGVRNSENGQEESNKKQRL